MRDTTLALDCAEDWHGVVAPTDKAVGYAGGPTSGVPKSGRDIAAAQAGRILNGDRLGRIGGVGPVGVRPEVLRKMQGTSESVQHLTLGGFVALVYVEWKRARDGCSLGRIHNPLLVDDPACSGYRAIE